MSKALELFGVLTRQDTPSAWSEILAEQICPYLSRKCLKIRKSEPQISIGTCSVCYGRENVPVIICPYRFLERRQVFLDCIHLLTLHEPGNELHIVPEITVPGGNVDYCLASVKRGKIEDFVAIELQALDTTGTVWPERQRFLAEQGIQTNEQDITTNKNFGMNWKMTAKTVLIQLHHKIQTFETINKHLVLVIQDCFLDYIKRAFRFSHVKQARIGDSMHIHVYSFGDTAKSGFQIGLMARLSTDAAGVAESLGLQASAKVELEEILKILESKISNRTLLLLP